MEPHDPPFWQIIFFMAACWCALVGAGAHLVWLSNSIDAIAAWKRRRKQSRNPLTGAWKAAMHLLATERDEWTMPIQGKDILFHARTGVRINFGQGYRDDNFLEVPGSSRIAVPELWQTEILEMCKALRDVITVRQICEPKEENYSLIEN